jgi:hypothetical protein
MLRFTLVLAATLSIGGCAIADHFEAKSNAEHAEKDYRACLSANLESPQRCQPLKEVWEADTKAL